MVLHSKRSQLPYDAAILLTPLRRDIGDSKFGFLVQALFAHVLLRLGGRIKEVKNQGHPDIVAVLGGLVYYIEVEAPRRTTAPRQLDPGDLKALQVPQEGQRGYFCILDSGPPLKWVCVDISSLGPRVDGKLRISLLRSYADHALSSKCTIEFSNLLIDQSKSLHQLTYNQLRQEALDSNPR